jgi:hypothetical protein
MLQDKQDRTSRIGKQDMLQDEQNRLQNKQNALGRVETGIGG